MTDSGVPQRRESDPRISKMTVELAIIANRLAEHEKGGQARSVQLQELEKKLTALDTKITTLGEAKSELEDLRSVLYGDKNTIGLLVKVDRVWQISTRLEKLAWAVVLFVITGLIGAVIAHLINPALP